MKLQVLGMLLLGLRCKLPKKDNTNEIFNINCLLVILGISMLVSIILKRRFTGLVNSRLTAPAYGKDVAEKMFREK